MPPPNIVTLTGLTGKTVVHAITTTPAAVVTVLSSQVVKIQAVTIANTNTTTSADVTVDLFRGSTAYRIASNVTVPAKATLVVISRDTAIWLEEADVLRLTASVNLYLEGVVSYDLVS